MSEFWQGFLAGAASVIILAALALGRLIAAQLRDKSRNDVR